MAINAAIVKILVQEALKAATDEEARKKIILIVMIPIIAVIIILTMFTYLISHPWEFFGTMFTGGQSTQIKQFHDQYYIEPEIEENTNDSSVSSTDSDKTEGGYEEENNN